MAPRKHHRSGEGSGSPELRSDDDALCIKLDELELGTQELVAELPKAWIAEVLGETDAITEHDGAARLELMLQVDRTLLVRGVLELSYVVPCARCLEPAKVDVGAETGELCVTFVPADRLRSWAELSGATGDKGDDDIEPLDSSELDEIGYEGSVIELRDLVSEQILLAYPMRALCGRGEACLGLCVGCGAELNPAIVEGVGPDRCPSCGVGLLAGGGAGGVADDAAADSPWKRALAKVKTEDLP